MNVRIQLMVGCVNALVHRVVEIQTHMRVALELKIVHVMHGTTHAVLTACVWAKHVTMGGNQQEKNVEVVVFAVFAIHPIVVEKVNHVVHAAVTRGFRA